MSDNRMDAKSAGYMELQGARKDADCKKVAVPGGVSEHLGCCNEYRPVPKARYFECGLCEYVKKRPSVAGQFRVLSWEELRHFKSETLEAFR